MKINVLETKGRLLDYLVAIAMGYTPADKKPGTGYLPAKDPGKARHFCMGTHPAGNNGFSWFSFNPSSNWHFGGPVIEDNLIELHIVDSVIPLWMAITNFEGEDFKAQGSSALEAAMRSYVISRIGQFVEIPDEIGKDCGANRWVAL